MDAHKFINQRVEITTVKDSKYIGIINGVRCNSKVKKFHVVHLIVCNKDRSYKAVSGNRELNKRWFNVDSVKDIRLAS